MPSEADSGLLSYNDCGVISVVSVDVLNSACNLCIECVVRTETYVLARMDDCAVLSDQDLTALYHLTAESLNTETLSIGIASVT